MFSTSIYYHEKPNQCRLVPIRPFSFNNFNPLYSFINVPTYFQGIEVEIKNVQRIPGRRSTHRHIDLTRSKRILFDQ